MKTRLECGESHIDDCAVDEGHAGAENRRSEYPQPRLFSTRSSGTSRPDHGFVARWSHGCYRRIAGSYLSSAPRSQLPAVATASYVLWQNSSNAPVGDSVLRTSSSTSTNSPTSRP